MANEQTVHDWLVYEYPDRDMDQLCQALMWQQCNRFGSAPVTYASAIDAWYASPTDGSGVGPPGSFTYYDIGSYGHVDWVMDSGNSDMATTRVVEDWGWTNRGWKNAWDYSAETGATILGWSWVNGANTCPYDGGGGGGGTDPVDYGYGLTTECQAALQYAMTEQSPPYYTGPADGMFGEKSVMGMQQWLKDLGYLASDYDVDGIPGPTYGKALQTLAAEQGVPRYTGPIDGEPGEATSTSLIGWADTTLAPTPPPPDVQIPDTPSGTFFAVDVATSQGDFHFANYAAGDGEAAIIKMGGGNASDSPYVAPQYSRQVNNARQAGVKVGHYWFNGRENGLTPAASAEFMAENMLLLEGDIVALDVEREEDTDTDAYSSAEAHEFATALREALGEGLKLGIYANSTVWNSGDWSWIEDEGHYRWFASWGANNGSIGTAPAEPWAIWQYTSVAGPIPGWESDSLDGNVVKDDTWTKYGYVVVVPPDPDPVGVDQPLRDLTAEWFGDLSTLALEYKAAVEGLPTSEPAKHRFPGE